MFKKIKHYILIGLLIFLLFPFFPQTPKIVKSATYEQIYTSGSGTFNVPAGATNLVIEVWGAGGGARRPPSSNGVVYGGGGGGGYARTTIATPASSYTYSVGTGGSAGTSPSVGGNSTVNSTLLVASGGGAGTSSAGGAGGTGSGTASTKTIYSGGSGSRGGGGGGAGTSSNGGSASGSTGGTGGTGNPNGAGGNGGVVRNSSGTAGSAYGGGGGAGSGRNGVSQAGANGAVKFTWDEVSVQYTLTYNAGTGGTISGTSPQTVAQGGNGTQVTAVPNTGYSFVKWSDNVMTAARTDTNVQGNISVTAEFAINQYTLTYTAGAGGTISGTSPQTVNYGSSGTTVTAVPNVGYEFDQWSDGVLTAARTDTNVQANITVTAQFALKQYTLLYNPGTNGSLSGATTQYVNHGSNGTAVTVTPNTGYNFVQWSDGITSNPRTDTNVTSDKDVTAQYTIKTYTLTYTAGAGGSITGTSPQTVNHGSSGTQVTAVPDSGYEFDQWSDGVLTAARTDTNVTATATYTASFNATGGGPYTLTYGTDLSGARIYASSTSYYYPNTFSQVIEEGGSGIQVNAYPPVGYVFTKWSDDLLGSTRTDTNVQADATYIAQFAIKPFNVTYLASIGGSISGNTSQTVNYNSYTSNVTAVPDSGYSFVSWSDGNTNVTRNDLVKHRLKIQAFFIPNTDLINTFSNASTSYSGVIQTWTAPSSGTYKIVAYGAGGAHNDYNGYVGNFGGYGAKMSGEFNFTAGEQINILVGQVGDMGVYAGGGGGGSYVTKQDNSILLIAGGGGGAGGTAQSDLYNGVNASISTSGTLDSRGAGYQAVNGAGGGAAASGTGPGGGGGGFIGDGTGIPATWPYPFGGQSFSNGAYGGLVTAGYGNAYGGYGGGGAGSVGGGGGGGYSGGHGAVNNVSGGGGGGSYNTGANQDNLEGAKLGQGLVLIYSVGGTPTNYTLTYTPETGGTISGTSPQTVTQGGSGTTVTAVPNTGYYFVKWSDNVMTAARTDTNVQANITVTAQFALKQYTLLYNPGTNGSLSGATTQYVNHGSNGTAVTVTPNAGYNFIQWSDGITSNPRTDTNVTSDKDVTAQYAIKTYTLTYTAGAGGSITGTSPQTINHGSSGTQVTAVPNTGYDFVQWSDGVMTAARTDTNVTANKTVTAQFALKTYTVSFVAGTGGSITGTASQVISHGGNGTQVTATPNAGYSFSQWSDGNTNASRTPTNVTANASYTAAFIEDAAPTYTLTYTAGLNGSISGASPQTISQGGSGTAVEAVPNPGYDFDKWSDDSTQNPRTDTNIQANISVTAQFKIRTYMLSYSPGANGYLTGTTIQHVDHGLNGTAVTATPNAGFNFLRWSDGVTQNPRTDTNVTSDLDVTAEWSLISNYTLTYLAGTGGSITGTLSQVVAEGGSGTAVTAVPSAEYTFTGWSDGKTNNPRTDTNVTNNISVIANFYKPGGVVTNVGGGTQTITMGSSNRGLVAHLPLKSNYTKSTATAGSEIYSDRTPYSNDGQNYGATVSANYLTFDGTNDYVRIPISSSLQAQTNLTMTAWVYPTTPYAGDVIILGTNAYQLLVASDYSVRTTWTGKSSPGPHTSGASAVVANQWNFITAVWDSANVRIYVNGILKNTVASSGAGNSAATQVYIGGNGGVQPFRGRIANVRIYNSNLSATDIMALYDQGLEESTFIITNN